ncbi:MAG: exopolyphosphatase [Proteobacteria bacterium]|nr:exopolyphosphatase [Pseudomonadota bacterium]
MRLITRSDFDGLVCAVFLKEMKLIDSFLFVNPKDVQDGKIDVSENDVLTNIPYAKGCGLWFDHHESEDSRLGIERLNFNGECRPELSTAQIIWNYYGGEKTFGSAFLPLLDAVNRSDSGDLTQEEILNPKDFILLSFLMDPRSGLGRFHDYRISNYQFMEEMIEYCRTMTIQEILQIPNVLERTKRYFEHQPLFMDMLKRVCKIKGNVIITDLLNEETIHVGNRFLVFALYPEQNIEVRIMPVKGIPKVAINCGHSIINRTCDTNIGKLMLSFGGGGHTTVGSCQIGIGEYQNVLEQIVENILNPIAKK